MNDRLNRENTSCKNPTLASEIIADQQKEIEELKLKLHKTEELRDLYYTQKAVATMQLDIINFISRIYSEETLTFIYGFVKSTYKHQIEEEQEGENDGEDLAEKYEKFTEKFADNPDIEQQEIDDQWKEKKEELEADFKDELKDSLEDEEKRLIEYYSDELE